jgi:hypothetical protein
MTYHNRTDNEYYPLGDAGVDFDARREQEAEPVAVDGLYFRGRLFSALADDVRVCLEGIRLFGELSLDADQVGNESGWKEPHATREAALRFSDKTLEEQRELEEAIDEWHDGRVSTTEDIIKELGDFKWCVAAVASNAGVTINDALKSRLYEYVAGTKQAIDGKMGPPEWYDAAAGLAIKRDGLTIGDIDGLIAAGFVPQHSPAMNLYEPEDVSPTLFMWDFLGYAKFLRVLSEQLYDSNHGIFHQGPALQGPAEQVGVIAAEAYLRVAALAHHYGSTFEEVVAVNTHKISGRVATNSVDKTDPNRSRTDQ